MSQKPAPDWAIRKHIAAAKLRQDFGGLLGVCNGLMADRVLNAEEVRFLNLWLAEHDEIAARWPGDVIAGRIRDALADGQLDAQELAHLQKTLEDLVGGTLDENGALGAATRLPCDDNVPVLHVGRTFCLTGEFLFGPRSRVETAIVSRGGKILPGIRRDLSYLVVGMLGSEAYRGGTFGTKIEKAVSYQRAGYGVHIISEEHWAAARHP